MRFILSRTEDYKYHKKTWIIGYGFLFWLGTRIAAVLLMLGCISVYERFGMNPETLTRFAGDPSNLKELFPPVFAVLMACLFAPLLEECIFRLGLSFRKWQIALAVASIPAYLLVQALGRMPAYKCAVLASVAVVLFCTVNYLTSQEFWSRQKRLHYSCAIWTTSIAFGLIHLIAFATFRIELLPYMLCVILMPFFAGCTITYYRVNLGFWWGVGFHVFNNLPAVFLMLSAS